MLLQRCSVFGRNVRRAGNKAARGAGCADCEGPAPGRLSPTLPAAHAAAEAGRFIEAAGDPCSAVFPMAIHDANSSQRLNSLRLSPRELEAVVDELDSSVNQNATHAGRLHTRFAFRRQTVIFEIVHPGGNSVKIPVVSVNLSRQGIGLLHSAYVHPGSTCSVSIERERGRWHRFPGEVIRCQHRTGRIHEIGIQFDEPIDAHAHLELGSMNEAWTCERVAPADLRGNIVVADDDDLVQRLVSGLLKDTSVQATAVVSVDEVKEKAASADLILCEYRLGGSDCLELLSTFRQSGNTVPVLVMSAEKTPELKAELAAAGATGFLGKPFTRDSLHRALAEFLPDTDAGPATPALADDDPRRELIPVFLQSLRETGQNLDKLIEQHDHASCLEACRRMAGQATTLGLDELGKIALEATVALEKTESTESAARELAQLRKACRKAESMPAPAPPVEQAPPAVEQAESPEEGAATESEENPEPSDEASDAAPDMEAAA